MASSFHIRKHFPVLASKFDIAFAPIGLQVLHDYLQQILRLLLNPFLLHVGFKIFQTQVDIPLCVENFHPFISPVQVRIDLPLRKSIVEQGKIQRVHPASILTNINHQTSSPLDSILCFLIEFVDGFLVPKVIQTEINNTLF